MSACAFEEGNLVYEKDPGTHVTMDHWFHPIFTRTSVSQAGRSEGTSYKAGRPCMFYPKGVPHAYCGMSHP